MYIQFLFYVPGICGIMYIELKTYIYIYPCS